jgi:hypothetical protein
MNRDGHKRCRIDTPHRNRKTDGVGITGKQKMQREPVTASAASLLWRGLRPFRQVSEKPLRLSPPPGGYRGARKPGEARGLSLAITFLISIALRFCGEFGLCCIRPGRFWA